MANKGSMPLEEMLEGIFNVSFESQAELARTFMRPQEHYENPHFRGKVFTLDEFRAWYIANSPKGKKTGKFTYSQDWDGFNIPSTVLEPFYEGRFNPLSEQEVRLLDAFGDKRETPFYVIGTLGKSTIATKKHEIGHGLFFVNPEYRQQVLEVVNGMAPEERDKVYKFLATEGGGYHPDVWPDEAQAYLLDRRCLGANGVSGEGLAKAGRKIKQIFRKYAPQAD